MVACRKTGSHKKNIPIITLLTDFGLQDEYIGVMKGVILSMNPDVRVVDITHYIPRHDVRRAALVLATSFGYFPKGSIHVAVVDPGVGGERKIICLKQEGHFFLAPDNGLLTMVIKDEKVQKVCMVSNDKYFLEPVSDTFHGRDIFAPVAAHLSKGVDMGRIGREISPEDLLRLDIEVPFVSAGVELVGTIVSVDRFGNLVTNIDQATFERFKHHAKSAQVMVRLGRFTIKGVSKSYDAVKVGSPLAIFGSRRLLEISLNQGDAQGHFKAKIGQTVKIT
ncbi:MAG: SAM-dependent chlorinase/fluorinase [Deltaproteobacteria bacterium]|jgi:S-adenosylmethionine hydrolase